MHIGIFGSGIVGQTLGAKLVSHGHAVLLGTRDPSNLEGAKGQAGSLRAWLEQVGAGGQVGSFAAAAQHGTLLINATNGSGSLAALAAPAAAHLAGKILIDVANPLDFSQGMPPTLFVKDTDSLAEQIQRAQPTLRVVKALNTMSASIMLDPSAVAGGDHSVFLSGDDAAAKAEVATLLRDFGWRDVIDLGDITTARGTEMLLPVWLRLWGALGSPAFNFKIAR